MEAMKIIKIPVSFLVLLFLVFVSFPKIVKAREICSDGKLQGSTYCPCPDADGDGHADAEYASVCGIVRNGNWTPDEESRVVESKKTIWSHRETIGGVTVGIYELDDTPTGLSFGGVGGGSTGEGLGLGRLVGSCATTKNDGKYTCMMRRVSPGNTAIVALFCGTKYAGMQLIPSYRSVDNFDFELKECNGEYTYTPPPESFDFAERDKFLGCSIDADDPALGFGDGPDEQQVIHESANVGVEGGDIRFTPFDGITILGYDFSGHPGAYWSKDCEVMYKDNKGRQWLPFLVDYDSVEQKCNSSLLPYERKLTDPFRYGLPEEIKEDTYRTFEHRFVTQREMQDPEAFAQYIGLVYGECIGDVFLRYYGDNDEDEPISCDELELCMNTNSGSNKNIHTTASFGSRLAATIDFVSMYASGERDSEDIVCRDSEHGDVKVREVQPYFPEDSCTPGEPDCRYKISYMPPQFFIFATKAVEKESITETNNDTYDTAIRTDSWELEGTEAEDPHKIGHSIVYSDESVAKNNSGTAAMRVASDKVIEGSDAGIMANRFVSYADAVGGEYDYNPSGEIMEIGDDVKSLCTISSVNGIGDKTITKETEGDFKVNNVFLGNKDDHKKSEIGATATYANEDAQERDRLLAGGPLAYRLYDYFDTVHKLASGEGKLEDFNFNFFALFTDILGRDPNNIRKSYAQRVSEDEWSKDKDAYIQTEFCISEANFRDVFPAYGDPKYPGDAGECYPWDDLDHGEFCDVYPGIDNPPDTGEGMRTCKVDCKLVKQRRSCTNVSCEPVYDTPPFTVPTGEICTCEGETTTNFISGDCNDNEARIRECLTKQRDTSDIQKVNTLAAPPLTGPDYASTVSEVAVPSCDLSRAGPMSIAGNIDKDHMARVKQQPLDGKYESQLNSDPINDSANYSAAALSSISEPVLVDYKSTKGSVVDYATTEDQDIMSDDGLTHRLTAGAIVKGMGTGASQKLRSLVSRNEGPTFMIDPIEEFRWSADCENGGKDWCEAVTPPPEIDLDDLDYGNCRPKIVGSCPLVGEGLGSLALDIIGAAGNHAGGDEGGVPGSLILAIIVAELGEANSNNPSTPYLPTYMNWDNLSIESYSEPWYRRIPKCNDRQFTAQGPYGLTSYDTNNVFENAVRNGGRHPSRGTTEEALKVVSKCNFIDATYAAAQILYKSDMSCGTPLNSDQVKDIISSYWGGNYVPENVWNDLVEIAVKCQ